MTKDIPIRFKPTEFETKWQKKWEEAGTYVNDMKAAPKPYYNLMMFPYPSAEGLHVGNMYAFTGVDIHGRFMRMQGYDVFEPIGLDGFGIHSENYAMKVGRKPQEHAVISEKNFYRQLRATGNGFDWTRTVETYDPDYYRWTQWLFVQMFKHGLAYRAKALVNWCPGCKTVLADEQVIEGKCERTGDQVEKKELEQWFFRITAYAERLLHNTYKPEFKWSEKVKLGQRNWIGKKEGIKIKYKVESLKLKETDKVEIEIFTTRPDTNYGATFIVISPEHPITEKITTPEYSDAVNKYIKKTQKISKEDRVAVGRKKTGVFTGSYAINQLTGEKMPIYVTDFVLMDVGTGAVIGVPGHDLRDFEFAQAMEIPIKRVVVGADGDSSPITKLEQVQEENGTMINSGFLNGIEIHTAIQKMMDHLEAKGWGKRVITYHLRDWLISRQRYWGAPIPMIYCEKCAKEGKSWFIVNPRHFELSEKSRMGSLATARDDSWAKGWWPVPENELPVTLPDVEDWRPTGTGRGPLAGHPEFYKTTCPQCGRSAVRETDVCDTFLDSSWYYLRYPSIGTDYSVISNEVRDPKLATSIQRDFSPEFPTRVRNDKLLPWNNEINHKWLPIDSYIGGAEHTVLHLLYTRFVWMALRDWNYLEIKEATKQENKKKELDFDPDEPFKRFFAHGLIIKDGAKMSKSKGNVVVPDEYIKLYGSDCLRTYLMFLGPFDHGGDFRDSGMQGMYKWLSRVWRLVIEGANSAKQNSSKSSPEAKKLIAKTIKFAGQEIAHLRYNTAIAKYMEFVNWWMDHPNEVGMVIIENFIKLLAPFAPHMTEELWQKFKVESLKLKDEFKSIHEEQWPKYDEKLLVEDTVTIVVQVNGKMRDSLVVEAQKANKQAEIEQLAKQAANTQKYLANKTIIKVIFIPGKIINFVV